MHNKANFEHGGNRDFCVCTDKGYEYFQGKWVCIDNVPRGHLVLWLSNTPHCNKLADYGVSDPQRKVVYITWQPRVLCRDHRALKKQELDAVVTGGSTDHWAMHVPLGSHYSNGKRISNVIVQDGFYDPALWALIHESL